MVAVFWTSYLRKTTPSGAENSKRGMADLQPSDD